MKPASFDFVRAATLDDVFAAFQQHGDDAQILAGGQSLMPILNMRLATPEVLVDINGIDELNGISVNDGFLRIGALTRHCDLLASPEIAAHAPLLTLAAPHIAHPAIRNRGTFGGSLCHADPAAELPACVIAAGARINVAGPGGRRSVEAAGFFHGIFDTDLAADEILTSVDLPLLTTDERVGFQELARRHGDYAVAGLAMKATVSAGKVSGATLVYFSVADQPLVAPAAAGALDGHAVSDPLSDTVMAALDNDLTHVIDDLHTSAAGKRHLAGVLLGRVLAEMAGEAGS